MLFPYTKCANRTSHIPYLPQQKRCLLNSNKTDYDTIFIRTKLCDIICIYNVYYVILIQFKKIIRKKVMNGLHAFSSDLETNDLNISIWNILTLL